MRLSDERRTHGRAAETQLVTGYASHRADSGLKTATNKPDQAFSGPGRIDMAEERRTQLAAPPYLP